MNDDDRTRGLDLGDLGDALESHDYPATAEELVEAYGEAVIELESGETTLAEVLEGYDDEFEDADAVETALLNMVGSDAVGREGYSDRGTGSVDGDEDAESV